MAGATAIPKGVDDFRVYAPAAAEAPGSWDAGVRRHYELMRSKQCMAFAAAMRAKYSLDSFGARPVTPSGRAFLERAGIEVPGAGAQGVQCSVKDMFDVLKSYVDASDPDLETPNLEHMLQTAERARAAGEPPYVQLVALVHDMGKAMFLFGSAEDGQDGGSGEGAQQWALGGDTWIVGCPLPDSAMILPELNCANPDRDDARCNASEVGIYARGCGVMAVDYAFGHDEYMYLFMRANNISLPPDALAMLRLHSCYPLHKGGAYAALLAPGDEALLASVRRFNTYDLYSKGDVRPDVDALWPHYAAIIDEFMPGKLRW